MVPAEALSRKEKPKDASFEKRPKDSPFEKGG
jgi:hypothetical protein